MCLQFVFVAYMYEYYWYLFRVIKYIFDYRYRMFYLLKTKKDETRFSTIELYTVQKRHNPKF